MSVYAWLSLSASIVSLCLGFAVYSFNKKAFLNKLFALASTITFVYSFTTVMMWQSDSFESAYFWNKMGAIWTFFVALVFHFALSFTDNKLLKNKLTYLGLYLPAALFFIIEIFTNLINGPPVMKYWGYNDIPSGTWLYSISTIWSALLTILATALCFRYYRKTNDKDQKQQRKFVTIGFAVPIATFIVTNMLFRIFNIEIPNLGIITTLFFSGFVAYAIVKHDLFTFDAAIAAENIVFTIPDSLVLANMKGKMLKVNKRLVNFSGYREDELIGKPLSNLCVDGNRLANALKELEEKRAINSYELTCKTKSGEEKAVLFSGSIVRSKVGRDIGITCVIHDITDRKKAEEELENNKNYLETLLNSMLSGIIVIDGNKHEIIDVNNTALKLIGATKEEVLGKICHKFVCPAEKGKCPITDLGLAADNQERMLLNANGNEIRILKNVVKLESKGRLLLIETFIDISERKKMEERLVKAERLASIGELAGQIGHDLRNPLTSIKSGVYFLKKKGDELGEFNKKTILATIDDAVEDSNRIINGLIDYSSDLHLETSKCTPKSLLTRALLKVQIPNNIEIKDYCVNEPAIAVDTEKIERVFANIISNSVEAMPSKGTLEVRSTQKDSNIEIAFTDSGEGVPEKVLSKMFSPLNTTKAKGMGLSLAICKRIVEAHNGKIAVESTQGKGTSVIITLPIKATFEFENRNDWITSFNPAATTEK